MFWKEQLSSWSKASDVGPVSLLRNTIVPRSPVERPKTAVIDYRSLAVVDTSIGRGLKALSGRL